METKSGAVARRLSIRLQVAGAARPGRGGKSSRLTVGRAGAAGTGLGSGSVAARRGVSECVTCVSPSILAEAPALPGCCGVVEPGLSAALDGSAHPKRWGSDDD